MNFLMVFIGGGAGSMLRYWLSFYNQNQSSFPYGTLLANILSSLILGMLAAGLIKKEAQPALMLLLATGFCGGFSTFSTFSLEALQLLRNQQSGMALLYITISLLSGLLAVYLGFKLSEQVF